MLLRRFDRRSLTLGLLATPLFASAANAQVAGKRVSIVSQGAKADGKTINTRVIQATIDQLAATGGGTVVVPAGVFVTGALFLKPGVHLHLDKGSRLRAAVEDVAANFPAMKTRIEGHFEDAFTPAIINAKACHGLRITGEGMIDGAGKPVWDKFYKMRSEYTGAGGFPNIGLPRARNCLIEESHGVLVEGVTFNDSQFWNLHLYKCQDVLVRKCTFQIPDGQSAPSSDGVDIDSCQRVIVDGCTFNVTDDAIACKGSKGPFAAQDLDSPPVQNIRVRNCHFKRAHQLLACGSEATLVRDVVVENCLAEEVNNMAMFKLRPDTPQHYEDVHFRNITLNNTRGAIITAQPWLQYRDLKGQPPPNSIVRNISLENIKGRFGSFGTIRPNVGQTTISDILFKDIDVQLSQQPNLTVADEVTNVRLENVKVNGQVVTKPSPIPPPQPRPAGGPGGARPGGAPATPRP
jgi:alpha-L-rhamnosidase